MVHHPYESFASVETFVRAAVRDPQVVAIKMTIYRIGANSPLIDLLVQAAEQGTQVAVVLELQGWAHLNYVALVLVCVALLIVGTFRLRNPARV